MTEIHWRRIYASRIRAHSRCRGMPFNVGVAYSKAPCTKELALRILSIFTSRTRNPSRTRTPRISSAAGCDGCDVARRRLTKNQTSQEERHEDRLRSIRPFARWIPGARTERQDHANWLAPGRAVRERPRNRFRGPDRRPLPLRRGAKRDWRQ